MKYLQLPQNSEPWFEFKRTRISGSTSHDYKPLSRGTDRTPSGFWKLLGQFLAQKRDGTEKPDERGHRLEPVAISEYSQRTGIPFRTRCGVWVSDIDEHIMFSPDGEEPIETPTYSAEVKALESGKHLKFITHDLLAKKKDGYNPIYSVPDEYSAHYRDQAVQSFVVNESLKEHHFLLYDEDQGWEQLRLYAIVIKRKDVQGLIDAAVKQQKETLLNIRKQMAFLIRELGIKV